MNLKKSIVLIIVILLIDQISKIYIKTHFQLHEEIEVFSSRLTEREIIFRQRTAKARAIFSLKPLSIASL